ncbi:TerB family tellurite resistance protein [Sphingobacterium spiritivorum]|uniref:TerB family tellurite resistance protein n=1 Tax=Sphingobacterium spiritivorum TaxID=258 RepID=UPI003DA41A4E
MKKILIMWLLLIGSGTAANAQLFEAEQLLLNVEKLSQFKGILKSMKDGYQILTKGYNTVKDISQGNFSLHKVFLDGLMEVSPTVRNYRKVVNIIDYQIVLIREYRRAFDRFRRDGNFNPDEIRYLSGVYGRLFEESLKNLDDLTNVITSGKMRMSDDERLAEIDRIFTAMEDKLQFLRYFNNQTTVLAVQRAKERNDYDKIGSLYGIDN